MDEFRDELWSSPPSLDTTHEAGKMLIAGFQRDEFIENTVLCPARNRNQFPDPDASASFCIAGIWQRRVPGQQFVLDSHEPALKLAS